MDLRPRAATPWRAPKRVGVLVGGRSAEREISLQSGSAMAAALVERGFSVEVLDVADDPCAALSAASIDVAVLALHGRWGEDGCIQGLLESQGIPYTGSGVLASALAMDKVISKRLFASAGLATPAWAFPATLEACRDLPFPLVLKPRAEGSSVGLAIVHDQAALEDHLAAAREPLMAEVYVGGHELTVAVIGSDEDARVLGSLEIRPAEGLYDFEAKYERDDTHYLVPAPLDDDAQERLAELALRAHILLGCRGATRADFRWPSPGDSAGEPSLLEVNSLPGMTTHSLLPMIAAHRGWTYGQLAETILADASLKA